MLTDPLTVSVDDLLDPVEAPFEVALTTVWQAIHGLLSGYQERYLHDLLGSGATLDIEQMLDRDGLVELPLDLGSAGMTTVRIWRGDCRTQAQRAMDRFAVEELPPGPRGGRSWAIRDAASGALVADDEGTVRTYSTPSGAEDWRRGQAYVAGYRQMPGAMPR